MSNEVKDGGPAFPNRDVYGSMTYCMSLRDWFAGMALQGTMANPSVDCGYKDAANVAYAQADAMLKAREAQP